MSEVIVAGGGPAGLAAAIAARRAGFYVSLFDGARPPIDKACGEGIMPDGLAALQRLGVTIPAAQACAFRGIRFVDDSHAVQAEFANGTGYGIRRVLLHELLVQHAADLGVDFHWGSRVTGTSAGAIEVDGGRVPFRWLICADGQNSALRQKSGLFPTSRASLRYGFRRHYRVNHWTDFVEVHWANCGQMYVTPISSDQICVAFITGDLRMRFDAALPKFSKLAARLDGAEIVGSTVGAVTASRQLKRVQSGRIALLGEAAGSVDAITGEGLSIAFRQAFELAAAMRADRLDLYQQAHERITRVPRNMSRLLLSLDQRQRFRQRVLGALEHQNEAFERMLAIHTGSSSLREFGLGQAVRLGWNLLHV
ncbi:MAG: FAD-dependent monooxygenase [Candidatus Korobacteraceae bacterium]